MVVGKSGDTVQIASQKMMELAPNITTQFSKSNDFADNRIHYKTDS